MPEVPGMPEVSDEVYVDSDAVACDGGGALGHPLVYLAIDKSGRVECPYCSRRFIYQSPGQTREDADPRPAEERAPAA